MRSIAEHLRTCPLAYSFSDRFHSAIARHEALPITPLALMNRGRVRHSTGQVHLQRWPQNGATSILDLLRNPNYFGNARLCLEDNYFVLHFSM